MLHTYFRQKIKKYALQLVALQGLIIIGLITYSYFHFLQYDSQKKELLKSIVEDSQVYGDFVHKQTINTALKMLETVEKEKRGDIFLTFVEKVRETTHLEYIKVIDEELKWLKKRLQKESIVKNTKDYFCHLQNIMFEFNDSVGSYDPTIIDRIFDDYLPIDDFTWELKENASRIHQMAYLQKTKREIRFMENKIVEYLSDRLPRTCRGCLFTPYYVDFIAPYQFIEGDDYTAKVRFTQSAATSRPMISVENKGLSLNAKGEAHYDLNTTKLGKHQIKGEITTKDRYGQAKTYPFTHEYTVLPKCN